MEPVSWKRVNEKLTLIIVAPLLDTDRLLVKADPFILTENENGHVCFSVYTGPKHVSLSRDVSEKCTMRETNNVYHELMAAADQIGCNRSKAQSPWQRNNCTVNPVLVPQIKRIAATNVIYCNGLTINVDGNHAQACPSFPFSLSVKLSFQVGNYTHKGNDVQIYAQQEMITLISERINRELLPGYNPFQVEIKSGNASLDWVEVRQNGDNTVVIVLCACLALALLLLMAGLAWHLKEKRSPDQPPRIRIEVKQDDVAGEQTNTKIESKKTSIKKI